MRLDGGRRETHTLSLTRCNGTPIPEALDELSVVARPHGVDRPTTAQIREHARLAKAPPPRANRRNRRPAPARPDPAFVTARIKRLDRGLLTRVQRIATQFPGRTLEVVSGYRPTEREGSRHRHARALDLRVVGISRERLRDFARTFDETGVGYYPNSVFVHVDVRDRRGYWVDRSAPNEEADYGTWPPPPSEVAAHTQRVLDDSLAAIDRLRDVLEEENAKGGD